MKMRNLRPKKKRKLRLKKRVKTTQIRTSKRQLWRQNKVLNKKKKSLKKLKRLRLKYNLKLPLRRKRRKRIQMMNGKTMKNEINEQ